MAPAMATPNESDTSIRILIVDDHDVVAAGLQSLLEAETGLQVIGQAGTVAQGLIDAARLQPAVVLVDYRLPDGTGAELAQQLRADQPEAAIVMITASADRRVLGQALEAGCIGFVSKNADRADLTDAIRAAATGESYFTRDVLKHLVHLHRYEQLDTEELSDREVEVLQLVADGLTARAIADQLYLSEHTVKNHIRHAMAKLGAHTKLDAIVKAIKLRLISID